MPVTRLDSRRRRRPGAAVPTWIISVRRGTVAGDHTGTVAAAAQAA